MFRLHLVVDYRFNRGSSGKINHARKRSDGSHRNNGARRSRICPWRTRQLGYLGQR